MHADRFNRFALTLFGLLLLAAGGGAMAASVGGFGAAYARLPLFGNKVSSYIGAHGDWAWWAAAGVALILALLALRWIAALLISTDRAGDLPLPGSKDHGTTVMQPGALTGALTGEILTYHGVSAANCRIIGDPASPLIVLTVTAAPAADLPALRQRVETQAIAHARQALANPGLPVQLDLDIARRASAQRILS